MNFLSALTLSISETSASTPLATTLPKNTALLPCPTASLESLTLASGLGVSGRVPELECRAGTGT